MNRNPIVKIGLVLSLCPISYLLGYLLFHLELELTPLVWFLWYWCFYLIMLLIMGREAWRGVNWQGYLLITSIATLISTIGWFEESQVLVSLGPAFCILSLGFWHRNYINRSGG